MFKHDIINDINILYDKYKSIYYLFYPSKFCDKLRVGDFVALSTFLFFLKQFIIKHSNLNLNNDNFYFVYSLVGGECYIDDLNKFIYLFSNVFTCDFTYNYNPKFSLENIITEFNLWQFMDYLKTCNIKIDNQSSEYFTNGYDIVTPLKYYNSDISFYDNIQKKDVFIMPVVNKKYNVERNMTTDNIIKFIEDLNYINLDYENVYIINKDNMCKNNIDVELLKNRYNVKELTNMSWSLIIRLLIERCVLYISGDCGLTHLIASLNNKLRPYMRLYYKTQYCNVNKKPLNKILLLNGLRTQVDFIPYCPYSFNNIQINIY